jgi:aminoglycoside phosphotransferase family enzyme/predicted kinase
MSMSIADAPLNLIGALRRPAAYPHPVAGVELVETHISWVLLAGDYAYKIKKPVRLSFLDFSTLQRRHEACKEELRLNRRLAPALYVDVVPIGGSADDPRIDGAGPAIEYAVRMHRFPQSEQLDQLLAADALSAEALEAFGQHLARFHAQAPAAAADDDFGTPHRVYAPLRETVDDLLASRLSGSARRSMMALDAWSRSQTEALTPLFLRRKREGHVREGHGDLHLANLLRLKGTVTAFDCIEFDPALRWIDTMSDVAFLTMDLLYRGRGDLAYRFLNAYLEAGGDYDGVAVLRYYLVYRALVRAKVAMIRAAATEGEASARHETEAAAHIALAAVRSDRPTPILLLTHGLSGSGKTWVSSALLERLPAIRIRSDVERKRLHGLAQDASSGSAVAGGLYTAEASAQTYAHLAAAAETILRGGETAIVDAAFLRAAQRAPFLALAARLHVACLILDCRAPVAELERRLDRRAAAGGDASEADRPVLAHQLEHAQPLSESERERTIVVDSERPLDAERLSAAVQARAAAQLR